MKARRSVNWAQVIRKHTVALMESKADYYRNLLNLSISENVIISVCKPGNG